MTRTSDISRKSSETDIHIKMDLDGTGKYSISTGVNFFNHMLESFAKHSMIDLDVDAKGDIEIDDHHKAEAVFKAFAKSLKEAIKIEHDQIPSTKGVL